jgi:hypothetical protein
MFSLYLQLRIKYNKAMDLINKYVWLVDTIYKAGRITYDEINQKWIEQDMDEKTIPLRTFHKWRIAIEEMFHLNIECERKGGYHYYIDNVDEIKRDGLRNWLWRTLSMSNLLLGSQAIKDRIILESIPSGQENLAIIVDAMKTNTQLTITYQSYWRDEPSTFTVYPYCVKLFKQRWYLVALSPYYEKVMIYALDRIKDMEVEDEHFVYPDDFDPDSFFEGCIGVIVDEEYDIETVRLKVSAHQSNYIRSLPMHSSQKEIERNDDYSIFTFEVRPTFDFQQEILMNGADMEVLSPERLRNEIAEKIENMSNNYKK